MTDETVVRNGSGNGDDAAVSALRSPQLGRSAKDVLARAERAGLVVEPERQLRVGHAKLELHPAATVNPKADAEPTEYVLDFLKQYGQCHPVVLFEGKVLIGGMIYKACEELDMPVIVRVITRVPNGFDPGALVVDEALASDDVYGLRDKDRIVMVTKRLHGHLGVGRPRNDGESASIDAVSEERRIIKAECERGKVSRKSVERGLAVMRDGDACPEVRQAFLDRKMAVSEAYNQIAIAQTGGQQDSFTNKQRMEGDLINAVALLDKVARMTLREGSINDVIMELRRDPTNDSRHRRLEKYLSQNDFPNMLTDAKNALNAPLPEDKPKKAIKPRNRRKKS